MRWLAALLALILPLSVAAEEVVLGLSQDNVAITATFDGSEVLVFGAIKREAPIPEEPLDVIVTIAGPSLPVTVRRKDKRFGIWVNVEAVEVDAAPSFYAISSTRPLKSALLDIEDLRHKISIPRAIRSVGAPQTVQNAQAFAEAVIRIRKANDSYVLQEGGVALDQQTLFRTAVTLPANLTEGDYTTRIFLTRQGRVVSQFETVIDVRKVGLERWLYTMSRQQPMMYGLMSLAIAIFAGWGAAQAFQMLRRG